MANASVLRALGTMAQHGGNYFGQVAQLSLQEKRKREAKADSEQLYARNRADKLADTADSRAYKEEREEVGRANRLEDSQTNIDNQMTSQDEAARRRMEEKGSTQTHETYYDETGKPITVSFDGLGKPLNVTPEELQGLNSKAPSGKGGAGGGKKTVAQIQNETRFKDAREGLRMMEALESEGHDPSNSMTRNWDNVMSSNGFTNWLASDKGQSYQAASTKVVEAFLRSATGAAAPEPEQKRYAYMLTPQAGDSAEARKTKRNLLRASLASMGEAAGMPDAKEFRAMVDAEAKAGGFYVEEKKPSSNPSSNSSASRRAARKNAAPAPTTQSYKDKYY